MANFKKVNEPLGYPEGAEDYAVSRTDKLPDSALNVEVGGEHYKSSYQPIQLMERVCMFPCCANIFKYIFRHKKKGGKQDLEKALHYCDLLVQLGGKWYAGTSIEYYSDVDMSQYEFYAFIKANEQLDANQIRAIIAILSKDMDVLKMQINKEISEVYS